MGSSVKGLFVKYQIIDSDMSVDLNTNNYVDVPFTYYFKSIFKGCIDTWNCSETEFISRIPSDDVIKERYSAE